jgi:hypothetical protein
MNFALGLLVIVMLGMALAYWLMQRRVLETATQQQQNLQFDQLFRPVLKRRAAPPPREPAATQPQLAAARINPAPNPLRELALVMYESQGYRRMRAQASEAPVQFWLHQPGHSAYALLELEHAGRISAPHISALTQRLPVTQERVLVLCKEGFTRDARALAKQREIKLLDNKMLKRRLAQLPLQERAALLQRVKHNLAHTAPHTLH